jgi:peptide/nickel transport system substrate-binding protein
MAGIDDDAHGWAASGDKRSGRPSRRTLLRSLAVAGSLPFAAGPSMLRAQAQRGGTLVIGTAGIFPRHVNPVLQTGPAQMNIGAQLFATPLTMVGRDWKFRPGLAESWLVSDDARSITLRLQPNARFHDGRPITSEDIRFSVEAARDNHPYRALFAPVNAVTLSDTRTAVIRLAEPHPALELAMTCVFMPILPQHVYGDGQPLATHPRNATNVVGSGPFRVVEFKPGESIVMERFDGWYQPGRPLLDRLIFRNFRDAATALLAFERGEIDAFSPTDPRDVERIRKVPGITFDDNAAPGLGPVAWLSFNTRHPQLADKRVRQAISYAIDRDFIVKSLFAGWHVRATGPIPPGRPFYSADVQRYDHDLRKATELLDAAGLRPGANGTRAALSVDYIPGIADLRTTAEYLRPALGKVGLDVSVRNSPDFGSWAKRVSTYQFDLNVDTNWTFGDPVIGVHRAWMSTNIREGVIWTNTHRYVNPRVDELLASAAKERDVARRTAMYREFQQIVVDDAPAAFLYSPRYCTGYQRRVVDPQLDVWYQPAVRTWVRG